MNSNLLSAKNSRVVEILDQISQPSTPFHETLVANAIQTIVSPYLSDRRIQFHKDRFGNLILHYWNAEKTSLPTLVLASHIDHPGFDILESDGTRLKAQIMGGLPRGDILLKTQISVHTTDRSYSGFVSELDSENTDQVWFELSEPFVGDCSSSFAVPDIDRFRISGLYLHGRAMDDLAGCAIQLAVFEEVVKQEYPVDFMAVFTRAEEVGFIGAQGLCLSGVIPKNATVISLEASKNIPGARPEKGVVIRNGDRLFIFDPNARQLLERAAEKCQKMKINIQQQRMDGGACEASLYLAYGYHTTAIAVPLINYHNHGDGKVEPEAIAIYDLNSAVALLNESVKLLPDFKLVSPGLFIADRLIKFNASVSRLIR